MRTQFDLQLLQLNNELTRMGNLVEISISSAVRALSEHNTDLAQLAVSYDEEIDQAEREIESLCLKLLLKQQPVARDLRIISSALKMITDLERIGDQASDISEIILTMDNNMTQSGMKHIPEMAQATIRMVNQSVDAFVKKDVDMAWAVIAADDAVDALFDSVRSDLIEWIRRDAASGECAMDLFMIAKYFERIGDHAVNVAEWVVFSITGTHPKA